MEFSDNIRTLKRGSIYLGKKYQSYDDYSFDIHIKFKVDIEAREWGIKGMNLYVTEIAGEVVIEHEEKDDEIINIAYDYGTNENWKIETELDHVKLFDGCLTIQDLTINFDTNEITIRF